MIANSIATSMAASSRMTSGGIITDTNSHEALEMATAAKVVVLVEKELQEILALEIKAKALTRVRLATQEEAMETLEMVMVVVAAVVLVAAVLVDRVTRRVAKLEEAVVGLIDQGTDHTVILEALVKVTSSTPTMPSAKSSPIDPDAEGPQNEISLEEWHEWTAKKSGET